MDPDTEMESLSVQGNEEEEKKRKWKRPPSSYGSMKSESDDMEEEEEEEEGSEGQGGKMENAAAKVTFKVDLPGAPAGETGLKHSHAPSMSTFYTMTTQQTRPEGGLVIETRLSDLEDRSDEEDDEDLDEILVTNSPEPPEFIEPEVTDTDENSQPGKLHPEQDLPHLFKSIQSILSKLTEDEFYKFKMTFYQWEPAVTLQQVMEGDVLDFVDKILETLREERALSHTLRTLEAIAHKPEADELRELCFRAMNRNQLSQQLIRSHQMIHEGVIQPGRSNLLDNIYVEPEISTCGRGGVDPRQETRTRLPSPVLVPPADTHVGLHDLFRQQKADGSPVKTVVTTGIAGIGMTVNTGRFAYDWAMQRANRDIQFVIKLSFRSFMYMQGKDPESRKLSLKQAVKFRHSDCKGLWKYLEEEDCKYLIMMDSFDCYKGTLDWENAPVITDIDTPVHPDVLIVNIIRGSLFPRGKLWILGRRGAVSQIPSKYVDLVTEIQGYSEEKIDAYLDKRLQDKALVAKLTAHYKRSPMLRILARQPFICWIYATIFQRYFLRRPGYGTLPPRITPFYVHILTVQINRRLEFYHEKSDNDLSWRKEDKELVTGLGRMALKMLERNTTLFYEEDIKEAGLNPTEAMVWCGLCTELPACASTNGRRTFCFIHMTVQEFMASLYVFHLLRAEGKNVLDSRSKILAYIDQNRTPAGVLQCALSRTLAAPPEQYDMFLRLLCGLLSPKVHEMLNSFLYGHHAPKMAGLDEAQRLLEQTVHTAEEKHRDRLDNLKECLREMTQQEE